MDTVLVEVEFLLLIKNYGFEVELFEELVDEFLYDCEILTGLPYL